MSSCMRYQQQISQMLDGELPAEQVQTLRAHLRTCPDCRHVYDDFLSLQTAVRDAAAEPPADLAARIMQQVRTDGAAHRHPDTSGAAYAARIHPESAGQTGRTKAPGLRPHISPAANLSDGGVSRAHPRRNALVHTAQKPVEQRRHRARQQPDTDRDRLSVHQ